MITLIHDGFHGRHHIRFRPQSPPIKVENGNWYRVMYRCAMRLNKVVCHSLGCRCGEHLALPAEQVDIPYPTHRFRHLPLTDQPWFVFIPTDGHARGNYPGD